MSGMSGHFQRTIGIATEREKADGGARRTSPIAKPRNAQYHQRTSEVRCRTLRDVALPPERYTHQQPKITRRRPFPGPFSVGGNTTETCPMYRLAVLLWLSFFGLEASAQYSVFYRDKEYSVGETSYEHSQDGNMVWCGLKYTSYEHSRNGRNVCAGGLYTSYEHSRDGSAVACGGLYSSYEHSRNGRAVCSGGNYTSYEHSRDGSMVTCGGRYTSYEHSRNGRNVCAGGEYSSYEHSRDGSKVACGGRHRSRETSRDQTSSCTSFFEYMANRQSSLRMR